MSNAIFEERSRQPLWLLALAIAVSPGCGSPKSPARADAAVVARPDGPRVPGGSWAGPLPPIPTRVSAQLAPKKTQATTRLDKKSAHRRLGELALAASREIAKMAPAEERAKHLASLCREVAPNVTTDVVDNLAGATFTATGKVKMAGRLQDPYDGLAQCLVHASAATRVRILPALLSRAAKGKDLSVFSFPFNSARRALALLTPAQVEPILRLAQGLFARARQYYHTEHLLAGMAAAGTVLGPARAQGLLARAERGVAGPAFKESREVFFGQLALTWVWLAERHPELSERIARAIGRLAATPYARAQALGKLVEMPGFSRAKKAAAVLELIRGEGAKLPVTERAWLRKRLIAQAVQVKGALPLLRKLVNDADKQHAVRARIAATRALAATHAKEAITYANEALDLIDKLRPESRRNWRQAPLFRALAKIDAQARQPLLARIEKRAAGFQDKYFTAWTLRKLIELHRGKNPAEVLRLQRPMLTAVAVIATAARQVRALRGIYKLGLTSGPASADKMIAQALALSGKGVNAWIWARFLRPLSARPDSEQRRWLPRLLTNMVRQATTWRPDQLARHCRQVARLAPRVMSGSQAEALLLQVWAAVESADKRSPNVQIQQVVNALRAIGTGLAALGSEHFPTLVRRMEARIPRTSTWSEPLMSYVAALGTLLPLADAAALQRRLEAWVKLGDKDTRLMRRGAIVAGLVASHGNLDIQAISGWLAQGKAQLSWRPMVQFLIRLPMGDLQAKAAAVPSLRQRRRMYRALIRATAARAKREPNWRRRRRRRRRKR